MGFIVNNSFGKFSAETDTSLPNFSAESLMSLPSKQFGAATLDGDNVTNYEEDHWSKFTLDKSNNTVNQDAFLCLLQVCYIALIARPACDFYFCVIQAHFLFSPDIHRGCKE